MGVVPRSAGGTGCPSSSTSPRTFTSSLPSLASSPFPSAICQGRPPPLTPRIGFDEPTKGPLTPTIVSNSRTFFPPELAPAVCTIRPTASTAPRDRISNRFIPTSHSDRPDRHGTSRRAPTTADYRRNLRRPSVISRVAGRPAAPSPSRRGGGGRGRRYDPARQRPPPQPAGSPARRD